MISRGFPPLYPSLPSPDHRFPSTIDIEAPGTRAG